MNTMERMTPEIKWGGRNPVEGQEVSSAFVHLLKDIPHAVKFAGRVFRGESIGFSFDVADRCPIGCDCLWKAKNRVTEMSADDMVDFFDDRRKEGYIHVNMVGGEPYVHLKSDLLERLAATMPSAWITTSGVTKMKHIPNVFHFVSVDGANAETHDRVRHFPGLYSKILKNLAEARATGFFPAGLHATLNSQNYHQIPEILDVWHESGLVDGVAFSTWTPVEGVSDEWLWLNDEQKKKIVADLLHQRKIYGDFLLNAPAMAQKFGPE